MAMTKIQEEARVAQLVDSYGAHGLAMMLIEAEHRGELIRLDFTNADGQPDCKMITHDEMRQRYADMVRSNAMQLTGSGVPEGLELAAQHIEKKATDYEIEHGTTDPGTGAREYPGDGAEYYAEMMELAEAVRLVANQLQPEHKSRVAQLVDTYGAHGLAMMLKGDTQVKRP